MKKSIAIDMDNVIVDIETNWINWYEKKYGIRITREAMQGIPEDAAFPDIQKARALLNQEGFFRHAPIMEGAFEALQQLAENFDIYIVSAAMEFPNSLREKYDWIAAHLPFVNWRNIVLCGSKSIIGTDYMIDDHVKNLDFFNGTPLLFTAGHNIDITRYTRLNNWKEVTSFFEKELLRDIHRDGHNHRQPVGTL